MCVLYFFKNEHLLKCLANEKRFLPAQPKHFLMEHPWSARAPFPHPNSCAGLRVESQRNPHLAVPGRCWGWDNPPEGSLLHILFILLCHFPLSLAQCSLLSCGCVSVPLLIPGDADQIIPDPLFPLAASSALPSSFFLPLLQPALIYFYSC